MEDIVLARGNRQVGIIQQIYILRALDTSKLPVFLPLNYIHHIFNHGLKRV